jgi:hypothetical protein
MKRLLNTSSMIGSASVPSAGAGGQGGHAGEDQVQGVIRRGAPAGLQHRRAGVLQNDGGTVDGGAGSEGVAAIDRGVVLGARHADGNAGDDGGRAVGALSDGAEAA